MVGKPTGHHLRRVRVVGSWHGHTRQGVCRVSQHLPRKVWANPQLWTGNPSLRTVKKHSTRGRVPNRDYSPSMNPLDSRFRARILDARAACDGHLGRLYVPRWLTTLHLLAGPTWATVCVQ